MKPSTLITCGVPMWEKVAGYVDQQTADMGTLSHPGHALAKVIWGAISCKETWQNASIEFDPADFEKVAAAIEAIDADPDEYGPVTIATTPEERWKHHRELIWNSSLRELEEVAGRFSKSELMELVANMDGRLHHLLRIRNYLDARVGGCGSDPGHDRAVKQEMKNTAKIRAIFGYPVTNDHAF